MIGPKVFIRHALSPVNEISQVRPLSSVLKASNEPAAAGRQEESLFLDLGQQLIRHDQQVELASVLHEDRIYPSIEVATTKQRNASESETSFIEVENTIL